MFQLSSVCSHEEPLSSETSLGPGTSKVIPEVNDLNINLTGEVNFSLLNPPK